MTECASAAGGATIARASAARGVELWCVDLGAAAPALCEMELGVPRLSSAEKEAVHAIADAATAAEWIATRTALRILIERAAGPRWRGVPFGFGRHGKPQLPPGANLAFTLSHAAGLALIGLCRDGDIGVDLERMRIVRVRRERRRRVEAAAAVLNAGAALPASGDARFLQAWVRLEAFAKAEGCGIGRLLTRLGAIGSGATSETEAAQRAAQEREALSNAATYDLALGSDIFAAATLVPAQPAPAVRWLPTDIAGLEALLTRVAPRRQL